MKLIKSFFRFWKVLFFTILGFFGLIDENHQFSRTNAILYVFVYKFATVPLATSSINELVGAVVALGGVGGAMGLYAFKKNLTSKVTQQIGDNVMDTIRNAGEDPTKE